MPVYLLSYVCKPEIDQFRVLEFQGIVGTLRHNATLLGTGATDDEKFKLVYDGFTAGKFPIVFASFFDDDDAIAFARRSVLVKHLLVPLCPIHESLETLAADLGNRQLVGPPDAMCDLRPWLQVSPFAYEIESFDRKYSAEEKNVVFDQMKNVQHNGSAQPSDPAAQWFRVGLVHSKTIKALQFVYFGAIIAEGGRLDFLDRYSLKIRRYIGTTTMPPELTFLMANAAAVGKSDVVLDPFVGTGAILLSAAHFGAHTIGFDMDGRVLRGGAIVGQQCTLALAERVESRRLRTFLVTEEAASVRSNFGDEKLPAPDLGRLNFSIACKLFAPSIARLNGKGFLDAIVTDPPYGIREQQRKVDQRPSNHQDLTRVDRWNSGDLMLDLVGFAAEALVVGGYLVYWHPTGRLTYTENEIPKHPSMTVISNVEQTMSMKISRRLIVMRKHRAVTDAETEFNAMKQALEHPADVRKLMDDTSVADPTYQAYRAKREAIREARQEWRAAQNVALPTLSRQERRQLNIDNRARNVSERRQKEQAEAELREVSKRQPPQPSPE